MKLTTVSFTQNELLLLHEIIQDIEADNGGISGWHTAVVKLTVPEQLQLAELKGKMRDLVREALG